MPLALYPLLGIAHQQADCLGLQQPLALLVYRRLSDCRRFAEVKPALAHRAVDYSVDRCRSQTDYVGFYAGDGFFVDVDIEYPDDADDVAGGSGGGGGVGLAFDDGSLAAYLVGTVALRGLFGLWADRNFGRSRGRVVNEKLAELGRPSRGEKTIAVAFFMTVFLWVFR